MINGDMESEVKLVSDTNFTSNTNNSRDNMDKNEFYPRVLIVTSSCIGDGLVFMSYRTLEVKSLEIL